ncbi:hypothetical protein, partial [Cryptobacterium curtum]|uniref:hypothetical protein n=1 Tax=Cryptobacterium curtum TaxID=84163 RepID=UPI00248E1EE2
RMTFLSGPISLLTLTPVIYVLLLLDAWNRNKTHAEHPVGAFSAGTSKASHACGGLARRICKNFK